MIKLGYKSFIWPDSFDDSDKNIRVLMNFFLLKTSVIPWLSSDIVNCCNRLFPHKRFGVFIICYLILRIKI